MSNCYGVLLDVVSIQRYVYCSNKLKHNLGASYLVKDIYQSILDETLQELFPVEKIDLQQWRALPEKLKMTSDSNCQWEIGYIGGGNALIVFRQEEHALSFVRLWTTQLVKRAPGLSVAVAVEKIMLSNEDFATSLKPLFDRLAVNKNRNSPVTTAFSYGINASCAYTGLPAIEHDRDGKYICETVLSQLNVHEQANAAWREYLLAIGQEYDFPMDFDIFNPLGTDNHLAIVHIDGNGMGKRFGNCKTMPELRRLSDYITAQTKKAFENMLQIIKDRDQSMMSDSTNSKGLILKNNMFPLRPIVIGGDDITFACPAKFGLWFAEVFIRQWEKALATDVKMAGGEQFSACGGVALVSNSYPFFAG